MSPSLTFLAIDPTLSLGFFQLLLSSNFVSFGPLEFAPDRRKKLVVPLELRGMQALISYELNIMGLGLVPVPFQPTLCLNSHSKLIEMAKPMNV